MRNSNLINDVYILLIKINEKNGIAGEPPKNETLTEELKNLAVEYPSTISFKYLSPTVAVIVTSVSSKDTKKGALHPARKVLAYKTQIFFNYRTIIIFKPIFESSTSVIRHYIATQLPPEWSILQIQADQTFHNLNLHIQSWTINCLYIGLSVCINMYEENHFLEELCMMVKYSLVPHKINRLHFGKSETQNAHETEFTINLFTNKKFNVTCHILWASVRCSYSMNIGVLAPPSDLWRIISNILSYWGSQTRPKDLAT
ncbi:hypothetical protein AGLY_002628 [Aphis glycines]|uniref:Uncharacterized protein n=1 Tax=Aphis glycines TaxID=307491 RepID=A0A6G0U174_APHGL|nr:hypothetical protein AGLY_002628 [Aphis glycines]